MPRSYAWYFVKMPAIWTALFLSFWQLAQFRSRSFLVVDLRPHIHPSVWFVPLNRNWSTFAICTAKKWAGVDIRRFRHLLDSKKIFVQLLYSTQFFKRSKEVLAHLLASHCFKKQLRNWTNPSATVSIYQSTWRRRQPHLQCNTLFLIMLPTNCTTSSRFPACFSGHDTLASTTLCTSSPGMVTYAPVL